MSTAFGIVESTKQLLPHPSTLKLDGALLVYLGLISKEDLTYANSWSFLTGYSLAETLLAMECISLTKLIEVSQQSFSRRSELVVSPELTETCILAEAAADQDIASIKIGELLLEANLIRPLQLHSALALSYTDNRRIGEIMLSLSFLTVEVLKFALDCQRSIRSQRFNIEQAARILCHCIANSCSPEESMLELGFSQDSTILAFGSLGLADIA